MPKYVSQWTGVAVTAIIVLGCDMDVLYAMPLGVFAGAVASFIVALADARVRASEKA
jgi:cell shape-determining protein MreD